MAPPSRRSKVAAAAADSRAGPEPALGRSSVLNLEGLDKVRPMIAADSNEWGATKIWPASRPLAELEATTIAIHLPAIISGLLPPFSGFFNAVLSHYQVHALHLDPKSILLLSAFAFLCEAFVGVAPSIALLRHFFYLRLTAADQRSGCVSLRAVGVTAGEGISMEINHEVEGFRRQWVYMDAAQFSPPLQIPSAPAMTSSGWGHERLSDPRLSRVLARMAELRAAGVTVAMVIREFLRRRIAPLQRHSRPMWAFTGPEDQMRLQTGRLPSDVLSGVL